MKISILMASALALASTITAASALTVTNQDKAAYNITVTPTGGKAEVMAVPADGKVTVDCTKGCILKFNGHEAKYDAKTADVTIKGGKFAKM